MILLALTAPAYAFQLITADDTRQKPGGIDPTIEEKGPIPGPIISVLLPTDHAELRSPVEFDVRFRSFAGSTVDVTTIRIAYVRDPWIDLTKRVRNRLGPKGFDPTGFKFDDGEVVPGTHTIRIEVRDTDGRSGVAYTTFTVVR
jgi:hypothetical protein